MTRDIEGRRGRLDVGVGTTPDIVCRGSKSDLTLGCFQSLVFQSTRPTGTKEAVPISSTSSHTTTLHLGDPVQTCGTKFSGDFSFGRRHSRDPSRSQLLTSRLQESLYFNRISAY